MLCIVTVVCEEAKGGICLNAGKKTYRLLPGLTVPDNTELPSPPRIQFQTTRSAVVTVVGELVLRAISVPKGIRLRGGYSENEAVGGFVDVTYGEADLLLTYMGFIIDGAPFDVQLELGQWRKMLELREFTNDASSGSLTGISYKVDQSVDSDVAVEFTASTSVYNIVLLALKSAGADTSSSVIVSLRNHINKTNQTMSVNSNWSITADQAVELYTWLTALGDSIKGSPQMGYFITKLGEVPNVQKENEQG